jgi:hypothetical protein
MRYHQQGDRVMTPSGLGVLEAVHADGGCSVRLINQETNWPFPQWVVLHISQIKAVPTPKSPPSVEDFEEAPF